MGSDRILKVIEEWNAEGRRRKRKLREQWMDGWSKKKHDQPIPHRRR